MPDEIGLSNGWMLIKIGRPLPTTSENASAKNFETFSG
jgi:hypothetical protein